MSKDLDLLIKYVKDNIPSAEILNISHTDRIYHKNGLEADCCPIKEGVIILVTRSE